MIERAMVILFLAALVVLIAAVWVATFSDQLW
jgi:hypothetical protein